MLEFLLQYRAIPQYALFLLVFLAALRWGDGPEKASGAWILTLPLGELAYHGILGPEYQTSSTDFGHFAMNSAIAAGFLAIALKANRRYPLWLAAFQLVSVFGHFVRIPMRDLDGAAYLILVTAPSYCLIATLAIGIFRHHRRKAIFGEYRSWRRS